MNNEDKKKENNRARDMAKACFKSIKDMVTRYQKAKGDKAEDIRQEIEESGYGVSVRSDWHTPGDKDFSKPTEYRIELAGGGPAVQLTGYLDNFGQADSAQIEYQDWFTEWTEYRLDSEDTEILLDYARCFWFGE